MLGLFNANNADKDTNSSVPVESGEDIGGSAEVLQPSSQTQSEQNDIEPQDQNISQNMSEMTLSPAPSSLRLYEEAMERLRRAEERRNSLPHGCTFKPELITNKSKKSKDNSTTPDRLSQTASSIGWTGNEGGGGEGDQSLENDEFSSRFDKLYQDAQDRESRLALTSLRVSMEVPFKPKLSKKAKSVQGTFEDRLKTAEERVANHQKSLKQKTETEKFAECTFKPNIVTKNRASSVGATRRKSTNSGGEAKPAAAAVAAPSAPSGPSETDTFLDRLQRTQELKQRKIESLKAQLEQAEAAELKFSPQLVTRASSRGKLRSSVSSMGSGGDLTRTSGADQPPVPPGTPDKANVDPHGSPDRMLPFYERVKQTEEMKKQRIEALRERINKEMGLVFKPNLVSLNKKTGRRGEDPANDSSEDMGSVTSSLMHMSLHERLKFHEEEKQRKLEEMRNRLREEEEAELIFRPQLVSRPNSRGNLRSSFSGSLKQDGGASNGDGEGEEDGGEAIPVFERLAQAEVERQRRLSILRDKAEMENAQEMPFQPQLLHDNNHATYVHKEGETIFDRLAHTQTTAVMAHLGMIASPKDPEATFRPQIRRHSFSAASNRMTTAKTSVFDRLQTQDPRKSRDKLQKEYSFAPKINSNSRSLSNTRGGSKNKGPIHERLYQQGSMKKQQIEKLAKEKADKEMEEFTFIPQIPQSNHHHQSSQNSNSRPVWERLAPDERAQTLQRQRREELKEKFELEECTFHPKVSTSTSTSPRPSSSGRVGSDRGEEADWGFGSSGKLNRAGLSSLISNKPMSPLSTSSGTASRRMSREKFVIKNENGNHGNKAPHPAPSPVNLANGANGVTDLVIVMPPAPPSAAVEKSVSVVLKAPSRPAATGEIFAKLDQIDKEFSASTSSVTAATFITSGGTDEATTTTLSTVSTT